VGLEGTRVCDGRDFCHAFSPQRDGPAFCSGCMEWTKAAAHILIAHMILIFLGSIHLGWHYAVDAYAAWAITLVLWPTAYYIAKWWEARPKVQAFNARYRDTL
jgi:hypothetical protein